MAGTSYGDLLKDPRWQKMRLQILERDRWRCQLCDDAKSTLHVHHRYYLKDKDPWEYEPESLLAVCGPCHEVLDEKRKALVRAIGMIDIQFDEYAIAFLEARSGLYFEGRNIVNASSMERAIGIAALLNTKWPRVVQGRRSDGTVDVVALQYEITGEWIEEQYESGAMTRPPEGDNDDPPEGPM